MPYKAYLETLSSPRSGIYRRVFRTQTDEEASGAVLWGQAMAMSLQALTLTFEVALRNRIHTSLSRQASSAAGGQELDSYAWYDHQLGGKKLEGETYDKVEALLCGANGARLVPQPTPDRVIARLSFGVWPNILDAQLPTPVVEAKTFRDVFPFHPKPRKHWNHGTNRKAAVAVVKDVQSWRNRLAHCKPAWSEGWYRNSATQHWSELLNRLKSRRAGVLEVLNWICPHTAQLHVDSFAGRLFEALATQDAVIAHLQQPLIPGAGPTYPAAEAQVLAEYLARK